MKRQLIRWTTALVLLAGLSGCIWIGGHGHHRGGGHFNSRGGYSGYRR